ncbi:MAG: serine hydrolase domain-containing protein [Bryobacteraceae bacterium]|nr:serine hydrolase domain-containing protein [Bryobacteraceae bacterium]
MRNGTVLLLALAWPGLGAESLHGSKVAANPEVAGAIRLMDSWIRNQLAFRQLPGLSVAVVAGDEVVWAQGFGYADVAKKTPVTPATLFRMASNSKMFTALAILQLRDAGKLTLDDPVSKHLPWFRVKGDFEDNQPITIRHLITHTSGLPRESASPYWSSFDFPTREQLRERLSIQEAAYAPSVRWKYSNLALSIAGEVVEAVSGEPYIQYIDKHLFAPLGMTASSMVPSEDDKKKLATGYARRMPDGSRAATPFTDCRGITAAAGLTSNALDMAKFMIAMMKRGKAAEGGVLRGTTLAEMQRVHWLESNWTSGWGLGFSVRKLGERTLVGHGGSLAGYKTQTAFTPADRVGVVVLTNGDESNPVGFVNRIYADLIPAVVKATKPAAKKPEWKPEWSAYVGRYRSNFSESEVMALDGELVVIDPSSDDPKGGMAKLVPLADGTFRIEAASGGQSVGEKAVFLRGASGKVEKLRMGWGESKRVD